MKNCKNLSKRIFAGVLAVMLSVPSGFGNVINAYADDHSKFEYYSDKEGNTTDNYVESGNKSTYTDATGQITEYGTGSVIGQQGAVYGAGVFTLVDRKSGNGGSSEKNTLSNTTGVGSMPVECWTHKRTGHQSDPKTGKIRATEKYSHALGNNNSEGTEVYYGATANCGSMTDNGQKYYTIDWEVDIVSQARANDDKKHWAPNGWHGPVSAFNICYENPVTKPYSFDIKYVAHKKSDWKKGDTSETIHYWYYLYLKNESTGEYEDITPRGDDGKVVKYSTGKIVAKSAEDRRGNILKVENLLSSKISRQIVKSDSDNNGIPPISLTDYIPLSFLGTDNKDHDVTCGDDGNGTYVKTVETTGYAFTQQYCGRIRARRKVNTYLQLEKIVSATSRTPKGWEDSTIYGAYAETARTPARFTIYTDSDCKTVAKDVDGKALQDITISKTGGVSSEFAIDSTEHTYYLVETSCSNYTILNKDSVKAEGCEGSWNANANGKKGAFAFKINGNTAGSHIKITASNNMKAIDPGIYIAKYYKGQKMSAAGALVKIAYYDMIPSSSDAKLLTDLQMCSGATIHAVATHNKNLSNGEKVSAISAERADPLKDSEITLTTVFPGSESVFQKVIKDRVTEANTLLDTKGYILGSSAKTAPRITKVWYAKTDKNGRIQLMASTHSSVKDGFKDGEFYSDWSDDLPKDANGNVSWPAGTYVISEVKGTGSYYMNPATVTSQYVTLDANGDSHLHRLELDEYYNGITGEHITSDEMKEQYHYDKVSNIDEAPKIGAFTLEKVNGDIGEKKNKDTADKNVNDGDLSALEGNILVKGQLYAIDHKYGDICSYYPSGSSTVSGAATVYTTDISQASKTNPVLITLGGKNGSGSASKGNLVEGTNTMVLGKYKDPETNSYKYEFRTADCAITPGTYRFVETEVASGLVNEYPGPATTAGKYFTIVVEPSSVTKVGNKTTYSRSSYQVTKSKWETDWRQDAVNNKLKHGKVQVQKVDEKWNKYAPGENKLADGHPQGDAKLCAEFTIYNKSGKQVYITETADTKKSDDIVADGNIVGYMYTDTDGKSTQIYRIANSTDKPFTRNSDGTYTKKSSAVEITLPYGTYAIEETQQPLGYVDVDKEFNKLHGRKGSEKIEVRDNGKVTDFTYKVSSTYQKDYNVADDLVIYGGIYVEKTDLDVLVPEYKNTPEGNGRWDNIGFTIKNASAESVWVDLNQNGEIEDKEIFAPGDVIKSDDNKYTNSETRDYTFILNHDGTFTSSVNFLPFGTYKMCEMSDEFRNNGYHMNPKDVRTFTIRQNGVIEDVNRFEYVDENKDSSFVNPVKRAGIKISKYDKESKASEPQGDAHLDGAVFAIWNTSGYDVYGAKDGYVVTDQDGNGELSTDERKDPIASVTEEQIDQAIAKGLDTITWIGTDNSNNEVRPCVIIKTDKNGIAQTSSIALPYGDYIIREVKAPIGYHVDDNFNMHVTVSENDTITAAEVKSSTNERSEYIIPSDHIIHGGNLSDLTGIGGTYTASPVKHDDDRYDADVAEFRSSPYDPVIRGSFILQKVDKDDYEAYKNGELHYNDLYLSSNGKYVIEQQGDSTFESAQFKVVNVSEHPIYTYTYDVNGERVLTKYNKGETVWTFKTDGNGYYEAPDDLLPYGTYEIIEESPSQGYKLTEQQNIRFTIGTEEDGSDEVIDINHECSKDTTENDIVLTLDGYTIKKVFGAKYQLLNAKTGRPVANKSFDISNSTTGSYPDDIYVPVNTTTGCKQYTKVAPGEKVYSCTTDGDGIFVLKQLPARMQGTDYRCGTEYDVTGGITGKLKVNLDKYTARFTCNLTTTTCYDKYPIEEPTIRGGLDALKIDEDNYMDGQLQDPVPADGNDPQGDARFKGAVFSIYNISDRYTWVKDEEGNWRRTYPMTTDGKWQNNDDIQPDVVYDPNEESNRICEDKIVDQKLYNHSGMTSHGNSVDSDNGAYTDYVPAFNGATSTEVIEKYHQDDDTRLFYNEYLEGFRNETAVLKITTDERGYATTAADALPYGTYIMIETEAPEGYMLARNWYRIVEVREDGHIYTYKEADPNNRYTMDPVIRGDVQVEKWDAELTKSIADKADGEHATTTKSNGESHALNNEALSGIEFKIYNVSDSYTYLWELTGNRNESLVDTSNSRFNTPLKIVNDPMFNPDTSDWWKKLDSDPSNYVMTITTKWNPSKQAYTAETYIRNEDGTKKLVDADGNAIRGALPYGTYLIRESKTNTKYEFTDGSAWIFQIREEGQVQTLGLQSGDSTGIDKAHIIHFVDQIERNDVWFNKIGDGDSVRMDTMWVIKNEDTGERHVIVTNGGSDDDNNGNGTYESGADVNAHTFHTNANDKFLEYIDANGLLDSETDVLTEKEAKDNGNPNNLPVAITMGSKSKHVVTKTEVRPGQKDPAEVVISDDGLNNNGMGYAEYDAGTWFGWCEFTTKGSGTSVNPYILSGDAKEELVVKDDVTGEEIVYHWANPDDSLKAFPYGHYTISEVRTDSNMDEEGTDYTLQSYSFVINNSNTDLSRWATEQKTHDREVDLGTITDDKGDVTIETELLDAKTGTHIGCADGDIILNEKIDYNVIGAITNEMTKNKYHFNAELYVVDEAEDGTCTVADDAKPIATAKSESFKIDTYFGSETVTYKFIGSREDLEGKKLVSYAYLIKEKADGTEVVSARHVDANDTLEQVVFPKVESDFIASVTGDKDVPVGEDVTLIDTIHASNIVPGVKYAAQGTLMTVDEDGNATPVLDKDGEPIAATSSYEYVSEDDGTERDFKVAFKHVDTTKLKGKKLVSYAYLLVSDEKVAIHEDITDERETVYVPDIKTNAIDGISGDQQGVCIESDKIIDTVSFENLTVGKWYTIKGTLNEKLEDGSVVPVVVTADDGTTTPVSGTITFKPTERSGKVDVTFDYNSKAYAGKDIVVYEELYAGREAGSDVATGTDASDNEATTIFVNLVNHIDANDQKQTVHYPEITTNANDANTNTKSALAIKDSAIVDTITYKNLIPGNEYYFEGTLMTKDADGKATPVLNDGKEIVVRSEKVVPTEANGSVDVTFKFDATEFVGKDITVFEKLLSAKNEDIVYVAHEDIDDTDQTVHYPEIGTQASDPTTGDGVGYATDHTTFVDTVMFKNLVPGLTYRVVGVLMDKETGKAIREPGYTDDVATSSDATTEAPVDDKTTGDITPSTVDENGYVTSSTTFVAPSADGTVDVTFVFDATAYKGRDIVAFEKLYLVTETTKDDETVDTKEFEMANHEDIDDEGQTIIYPDVHTEALDGVNKLHEMKADKEAVIVDTVYCKNLVVGKEYTINGTLMNKTTNSPLVDADGNVITATTTFTAEEKICTKELEFKFNASLLRGETIVVFETLLHNNATVATHNEIEDTAQTVYLPDIKTIATSLTSGSKLLDPIVAEAVKDEIKFSNLIVGHKYRVAGKLVDKSTGKALVGADGKELSGQVEFTADVTDGSVFVEFGKMDASTIKDKDIVVFEYLYNIDKDEPVLLVEHDNLNDTDETVHVTNPTVKTVLAETDTESKVVAADKNVNLTDVIVYTDLIPGNEYVVVSTLVDKATGKTLKNDAGKDIVIESKSLKPEKATAEIKAKFKFSGTALKGKVVVAYNDLYRVIDGKRYLVVSEHDLKNADQTVTFPTIGTTATDATNGTHTLEYSKTTIINDRVAYKGLEIGKQYTVTGTPYDKATGKPLEGVKPVSVEFTASSVNGYVDVRVTVDTTKLVGKKIVMFESVSYEGKEIAVHNDIKDADQTVTVCKIGTTLTGADKTSKKVDLGENVKLVDTVKFEGLVPGQKYVLTGQIIDKESYKSTTVSTKAVDKKTTEATTTEQTTNKSDKTQTSGNAWDNVKVVAPEKIGAFVNDATESAKTQMSIVSKSFKSIDGSTDLYTMSVTMKVDKNDTGSNNFGTYVDAFDKNGNKIGQSMFYYVKSMDTKLPLEVGQEFTAELRVPANAATIVFYENKSAQKDKYEANSEAPTTEQTTAQPTTEAPANSETPAANNANGGVIAENSIEFTPTTADGTVEIEFVVNTKDLKGHHLVAFETVSDAKTKKVVAEHKDINDEDQTVVVKTSTNVKTGVQTLAIMFAILSLLALAGFAVYTTKTMRKQRVDGTTEENDMDKQNE